MRVVRFLVRNWPLKIGAVILAVILYGGIVLLQNARPFQGQVQIVQINQPSNAVLLTQLPMVTSIRYLAPPDVPVNVQSFTATVNLGDVKPSESQRSWVRVNLTANDPRIQILDYDPQQIQVQLDPLIRRTVPVRVKPGTTPPGLDVQTPTVSQTQVTVFGASSDVTRVNYAEAPVSIEPSGLDVDQNVDLVAYDAGGNVVTGVEFDPRSVRVKIIVGSQLRSVTLPISPAIDGVPAQGYVVTSVDVAPLVAEVRGEADALAPLRFIATQKISVAGATSDVTSQVPLNLPTGVDAPGITNVKVTVHLQAQSGSRSYSVAVVESGARNDRTYQLSTAFVQITLAGPLATLNALDTSSLFATAAVGDLGPGTHTVNLTVNVPAGVRLASIAPSTVAVTVVLPPTPPPTPSATPTAPSASPSTTP